MHFCVVLCIVCFVTFPVLFVCICVLNNCHRVATQLQLNIYISYSEKASDDSSFKSHLQNLFLKYPSQYFPPNYIFP